MSHPTRALAALSIVLGTKLAVVASLAGHPLLQPTGELDGAYYAFLAGRVAGGDVWLADSASFLGHPPPPFFVSPLYIYVLALVLKVAGGSLDVARYAQAVLGTAAVGLVALTANRWYGRTAAWFAGALAALCGLFTFYETLVLQAALDPFLTSLDLYAITRAVQDDRPRWWAAAGAALGLHVLNRPNLLVVLAGIAAASVLLPATRGAGTPRRRGLATMTGRGLAMLAAALLAIAPATIRNWRVAGESVLISSHGGFNFLVGNGPQSDGTFTYIRDLKPSVTGQWLGAVDTVRRAVGHEPTASEVSRFFYVEAWRWLRTNPAQELVLLLRKTWYALSASFLTLNHSYPFFEKDVGGPLGWLVVGPGLIVPLGIVGLVVARPRGRPGYWIWAAYVPLAIGSVVIFYVAARYRLPYQVALTIAAGGGLAWALDRGIALPTRLRAGAVLLALALIVNWPTGLDDGRAEEQVRMGLREIESGRAATGEVWIARAVERHGFPGVVHVRAGQAYETRNAFAEALRHYDAAMAIDADEPAVHLVRGRALYHLGRFDEARAALERAQHGAQVDAAGRLLLLTLLKLGDEAATSRVAAGLDVAGWSADDARGFADALMQLGRADLGIPSRQRAAQASGQADDYERLGLALAVAGRRADAAEAFRDGVRRDPRSASLRLNLAVMLADTGQLDAARREAAEALRLDPNYDRAKRLLEVLRQK